MKFTFYLPLPRLAAYTQGQQFIFSFVYKVYEHFVTPVTNPESIVDGRTYIE
jgi:hypothetical protein